MQEWTDKPWERQKGESEQAFEAFSIYRDMVNGRSLLEVSKRLKKSRTLIDRWRAKWDWPERARAYDNELEREAKAQAVKELRDMTDRHIKIAKELQRKALEALKDLPTEKLAPKDIKEYIKVSTELERLNREFNADDHAEQEASKVPIINIICDIPREAPHRTKNGEDGSDD